MSEHASQMSIRINAASVAQLAFQEQQESLKRSLHEVASLSSARMEIASAAQRALQEHRASLRRSLREVASLSSARMEIASAAQRALQEQRASLKRSLREVASLSSARMEIASAAQRALQEQRASLKRSLHDVASLSFARMEVASAAQRALQEQRASLKRSLHEVTSLASARSEAASAASRLLQGLQENNFATEIARHIHVSSEFQQTRISIAAQVLEQVHDQDIVIDEIADLVQEAIEEKSKKSPRDIISIEGLINFLFVIIFFLINMQYSKEAEDRIIKKIDKIHEPLINFMEKQEDMDTNSTYYFVNSSVNLRALPNTESSIITVLHPNQRVEFIEQQDGWLYVRYFDHLDGVPRVGWVYHRYLSLVQ